MEAQKENYSNGHDFAKMGVSNNYEAEESNTVSEIEATNQIHESTFITPRDLVEQYPAEDLVLANFFTLNEQTTLSSQ
ncbi:hypothetical protein DSO57_1016808, partial [Entomophthora muscae]